MKERAFCCLCVVLIWLAALMAPAAAPGKKPARPATDEFVSSPRLYLLAVGVSRYVTPSLRLTYPAKDARDLASAFSRQQGLLYREVNTRLLLDEQAKKSQILDGLEWMQRQTTAHDVAVFFFAGHGINDPGTGRYHFLPADADLSAIKRSMVSQDEIQSTLRSMSGKVLLFLDTCHAGNLLGQWAGRGVRDLLPFITELASSENGVVVFAASTGRQLSQEAASWDNGAFTKAAVEGLSGKAAFVGGRPITINMLDLYISERVKELTQGLQTPTTAKPSTVPDFPIAVLLPAGTGEQHPPPVSVSEPRRQDVPTPAEGDATELAPPSQPEEVQAACQKSDQRKARALFARLDISQRDYVLFFCKKMGVALEQALPMEVRAACEQRAGRLARSLYEEIDPAYKSTVYLYCQRQGIDLGPAPPSAPVRDPQVVELRVAPLIERARASLESNPKETSKLLAEAIEDYGDHGGLWLLFGMAACKQKNKNDFFAAYRRLEVKKQQTLLEYCRQAGVGPLFHL